MDVQRYFIKLAYKGTHFFGWQIQPNAITVQETLALAITKLNHDSPVKLTGCGRTDTGVHATEFYAHFDLEREIDVENWQFKLNCILPETIAIYALFKVPIDLHTRFSATARTYHYFIRPIDDPFNTEVSWLVRTELDISKMNTACQLLLGKKNFKCFSKTITGVSSFECEVTQANWEISEKGLQFTIKANRFLRNMVRAIVGTLVDVGSDKTSIADFEAILKSQDRNLAGKSAPAQGLFLVKVDYENDKNRLV